MFSIIASTALFGVVIFLVFRYYRDTSFLQARILEIQGDVLGETQKVSDLLESVSYYKVQNDNYLLELRDLETKLKNEVSRNKSVEVRTGFIMEKIVPFLDVFKHDPEDTRFLGNPIDMICFDLHNDEIVFVEIKSGKAKLTQKQKYIQKLVNEKKVRFEVIQLGYDELAVKEEIKNDTVPENV